MLHRVRHFAFAAALAVAIPAYSQPADITFVGTTTPTVQENAGMATFSLKRTGNLTSTVSAKLSTEFWYGTTGPMPFGPPSMTTVTFAPNETLKTFTVPVLNDQVWSRERNAAVVLRDASPNTTLGGQGQGNPFWVWVTVSEDEPFPSLVVSEVRIPEGNAGTAAGAFTIGLSPALGPDATANQPLMVAARYLFVDGTARRGIDYSGNDSSFWFTSSRQQVTVPFNVIGNTTPGPNKTFRLHFDGDLDTPPSQRPQLPPDVTCTILNDDAVLLPSNAQLARGNTMRFSLDIGLPPLSALDIPLRVSQASVLEAPASVHFNSGQSTANISVTGKATGSARLSLDLPPQNGGATLSSIIGVFEAGSARFEPGAIVLAAGEESAISISLSPASSEPERLPLTTGNPGVATVPAEVIIPPGGTGTFTVKAIAPGATYVNATLPQLFGGGSVTATLDVVDKPPIPTIISIEPATGSANGGNTFLARGTLLHADCRLLFGGAPATLLTLSSEGMFIGSTPPHSPGAVDVTLTCGSNTFVLTKAFTYQGGPRTRSARH